MKPEDEEARRAHRQQRFALYGVLAACGVLTFALYLRNKTAVTIAGCVMLIALLAWAMPMARDPVGSDRADWPGHDGDHGSNGGGKDDGG